VRSNGYVIKTIVHSSIVNGRSIVSYLLYVSEIYCVKNDVTFFEVRICP
jgi:hypothetical protein